MGQVVAFVSGKGGTGKTTLCAAVASFLAKEGRSVLCVDLDVGLRNLDISLGMRDEASVSFLDVIEESCTLADAPSHPLIPSLRLLTAPVAEPESVPEHAFYRLLAQARERFDWILLDAPAGIGALFRMAVRRADRTVVVTQADPASMRDAERAGALAGELGPRWTRVVVNRVSPRLYNRLRTNMLNKTNCYIMYAVVGTWRNRFGLSIGPVDIDEYTGVYVSEIYFDYELVGSDQIRLWINGEYDEMGNAQYYDKLITGNSGNGPYLTDAFFPFAGKEENSARTFKIETDDLKDPSYLKLVDQDQKSNIITLTAEQVMWPFGDKYE